MLQPGAIFELKIYQNAFAAIGELTALAPETPWLVFAAGEEKEKREGRGEEGRKEGKGRRGKRSRFFFYDSTAGCTAYYI